MILKLALVIGVIALVYFMFIKKKPLKDAASQPKKKSDGKTNEMVECSTCEVYTEINECILSNGKYYCSSECVSKAS